jgi:hypothetical protein
MSLRKIYLAVDCRNDEEAAQVQKIAEDVSMNFDIPAKEIIEYYPMIKKNKGVIKVAVKTLVQEKFKGVGKVVAYLMQNMKK